MSGMLTLNVTNKCENNKCICIKDPINLDITVTKDTSQPTNGFIKVIHKDKNGRPFTLSGTLSNGEEIRTSKGIGNPIKNVTEVELYFWNGNPDLPILLGITSNRINGQPKYYSHSYYRGHGNVWSPAGNDADKGLEHLLDWRNCQRNSAIIFNIKDSQSGSFQDGVGSKCMQNKRILESTTSPPSPPGSEYMVTGYMTTGLTKISRVTLRGQPITISPPTYPVSQIRLYSYPASDKVPLLIEFIKQDGTGSEWYESQDPSGQNWTEYIGYSSDFYDGGGDPQPTSKLSEKLDEVLCIQYGNTTLDISYGNSSSGEKYCCEKHKTITIKEMPINGKGRLGQTKLYRYHINGEKFNLGGIKYYDNVGGDRIRKKINFLGQRFPISGVKSIYAFYCGGKPVLVYVDTSSAMAKGWYRKKSQDDDTSDWIRRYTTLSGITPDSLDNITCDKWNKLMGVLKRVGCTTGACSDSSTSLTRSEHSVVQEQGIPSGEYHEDNDDDEPPPVPSALQADARSDGYSGSSTPSSHQHIILPVKPTLAGVSPGGARRVTIRLDSKSPYPINHRDRKTINVSPYKSASVNGYSAFQHSYGGKDLKINKFTVESKGQTFPKEAIPVKDVSVVVFFTSCTNSNDPATGIPLLAYIGSNDGKRHHWYTRNKNSNKWYDVPYALGNKPPSKVILSDILRNVLDTIKRNLGVECEMSQKGPVYTLKNSDNNHLKGLGESRQRWNNFGHSGNINNAISHVIPSEKPLILQLQEKLGENVDLRGYSVRPSATDPLSTFSNQAQYSNNSSPELGIAGADGKVTPEDGEDAPSQTQTVAKSSGEPEATTASTLAPGAFPPPTGDNGVSETTPPKAATAPITADDDSTSDTALQSASPESSDSGDRPSTAKLGVGAALATGSALAGYVIPSVFGVSALACFAGYKLYNRYRGEPWVRQMSVYGSSRGTLDTSLSTE